jgi:putative transposase
MPNNLESLIPEYYYHIYNRANGNERMFKSAENYRYFLAKFIEYIHPIADTFYYCLMPNHFHFLIRIKSERELQVFFKEHTAQRQDHRGLKNLDGLSAADFSAEKIQQLISKHFSNFFNAYSKAYNKAHNRLGSLFMHPYKRKQITDTSYLIQLILYIHHNPLEAKLANHLEDWPYSSYPQIIAPSTPSFLKREEVLEWVNGIENFKFIHSKSNVAPIIDD